MFKLVIFNHWIVSPQTKIHSEIDEEPLFYSGINAPV